MTGAAGAAAHLAPPQTLAEQRSGAAARRTAAMHPTLAVAGGVELPRVGLGTFKAGGEPLRAAVSAGACCTLGAHHQQARCGA